MARLGKIAPSAAVLVIVGYWCWPWMNSPNSGNEATETAELGKTPASLLSPTFDPPSERDPFRISAVEMKKSDADEDTNSEATPAIEPIAEMADLLGSLTLNATLIRGDRRLAMINDHLYAEGDAVPTSGSSTTPYLVADIYPDRVVLQRLGQSAELNYAGPDIRTSLPAQNSAASVPKTHGRPASSPLPRGSANPKVVPKSRG